jgi:hypothetical protein
LAAITGSRFGTVAKVGWIVPVAHPEVVINTPSAPMASWQRTAGRG